MQGQCACVHWRSPAESYRRAVDLSPLDFRAWYGLGQAYELLKMPYFAIYYARWLGGGGGAVGGSPSDPTDLGSRCPPHSPTIYLPDLSTRPDPPPSPSARAYRRAATLRPLDARMWCALGQCYVSTDQVGLQDLAIRCYRRAIEHNDPDGIAAHMLVGRGLHGRRKGGALRREGRG